MNKTLSALERERKIEASGVRRIFTPFAPIKTEGFLLGRAEEVQELISSVNTPGQYALIYGNRGVGKSSLAVVVSKIVKKHFNYDVFITRCDSETTLTRILSDVLVSLGIDPNRINEKFQSAQSGAAKAGVGFFGADIKSQRTSWTETDSKTNLQSSAWLAKLVKDKKYLLVVDEADAIKCEVEKRKISEFLKILSDSSAKFKMIIVGVATTGKDLIENHKSVERCINEIVLSPIKISALKSIVTEGAKRLNLHIEDDVVDDIVDISCGYPHFVHLIALRCAEQAIIEELQLFTQEMLPEALRLSAKYSDGRFKRIYEECIEINSDVTRKVLLGAALCHHKGFLVRELLEMTTNAVDNSLSKWQIENCLRRIVNSGQADVITRVGRGHYRFADPRMPSYIRMLNGFTFTQDSLIVDILRSEYGKRYGSTN